MFQLSNDARKMSLGMIRLIVQRAGRRVFGWAYTQTGVSRDYTVELLYNNDLLARQDATLTLPVGHPLVPNDQTRKHGFEFIVHPDHLRMGAAMLAVRVVEDGQSKLVPTSKDSVDGTTSYLFVDEVDFFGFRGWAWDVASPDTPASLQLIVPASDIARPTFSLWYKANLFREDLADRGFSGGNCGFIVKWPTAVLIHDRTRAVLKCGALAYSLGRRYRREGVTGSPEFPDHFISL